MNRGIVSRRSISVEDLGTIVRQMINGALEDTEQMAKLHRAIYEELYLEKLTEFGSEITDRNDNSSERIFKTESIQNMTDGNESDKCPTKNSETNCSQKENECFRLNGEADDEKVEKTINERTEKLINKNSEGSENQMRKLEDETKGGVDEQREKSLDYSAQSREQAFDVWKREKIKATRRMLTEERKMREEKLAAKQKELENKRANHEAYMRSKKIQDSQRKLEEAQRREIGDNYWRMQGDENRRIVANEEAFKAWTKRKNNESGQKYFQPRKSRPQTARARYCGDAEFDSWLDQLDSVLHQKYIRERRYRVRSFYCQPAYYGTAALCMQ